MKIELIETIVTERFRIDYENGVLCDYSLKNGELEHSTFIGNKRRLVIVEDIKKIRDSHWSNHHEFISKTTDLTIEELSNFKDFDKLYYVGCGGDGMVYDIKGEAISTILRYDDIFNCVYMGFTTEKTCREIKSYLEKSEYVSKIKLEDASFDDDVEDPEGISFEVSLPDDLYREFLGEEKYLGDSLKKKTLLYILDKVGYTTPTIA